MSTLEEEQAAGRRRLREHRIMEKIEQGQLELQSRFSLTAYSPMLLCYRRKEAPDKVTVSARPGGRVEALVFEDSIDDFPSDDLIAQLALVF